MAEDLTPDDLLIAVASQVLIAETTNHDPFFPFVENILIEAVSCVSSGDHLSLVVIFRDLRVHDKRFGYQVPVVSIKNFGVDASHLSGVDAINAAAMTFLANLERALTLGDHLLALETDGADTRGIIWVV